MESHFTFNPPIVIEVRFLASNSSTVPRVTTVGPTLGAECLGPNVIAATRRIAYHTGTVLSVEASGGSCDAERFAAVAFSEAVLMRDLRIGIDPAPADTLMRRVEVRPFNPLSFPDALSFFLAAGDPFAFLATRYGGPEVVRSDTGEVLASFPPSYSVPKGWSQAGGPAVFVPIEADEVPTRPACRNTIDKLRRDVLAENQKKKPKA
jgi:hypothetical protein